MNNILQTHRAELAKALRNHHYERTPTGVLFPKQKTFLGGVFSTSVNGEDPRIDSNTVVNIGLDDVLNVYFGNVAKRGSFYLAPFSNFLAVDDDLVAADFPANYGEFTNYNESARVAWVHPNTTTTQTMANSATPARFTILTGGGTIWGCMMTVAPTKNSASGPLVAGSLFDASRVLLAADKLDIEYIITAADASA